MLSFSTGQIFWASASLRSASGSLASAAFMSASLSLGAAGFTALSSLPLMSAGFFLSASAWLHPTIARQVNAKVSVISKLFIENSFRLLVRNARVWGPSLVLGCQPCRFVEGSPGIGQGAFFASFAAHGHRLILDRQLDRAPHGAEQTVLQNRTDLLGFREPSVGVGELSKRGLDLGVQVVGGGRFYCPARAALAAAAAEVDGASSGVQTGFRVHQKRAG